MKKKFFDQVEIAGHSLEDSLSGKREIKDLFTLKAVMEYCQVEAGLLKPYAKDYPVIESRELQPPFDPCLWEHLGLPGFSMLALDRTLNYQAECFQFDLLHDPRTNERPQQIKRANLEAFLERLPRRFHGEAEKRLGRVDITRLKHYPAVLNFILVMDRAHVVALSPEGGYRLLGFYASFPSDLDREIKRFGFRIGKFRLHDNALYQANRLFVYRYLMELFGFPISSERRTSAAMFARQLSNQNENYFISVLGNSDRVLTFISSRGRERWPLVEKIALVSLETEDEALRGRLMREGFFVDAQRGVVLFKVTYAQHQYNLENIMEDRALSVVAQAVLHPRTGRPLELDLLRTERSRLIRLNDIVRGEHEGQIIYRGQEIIHGTEDVLSRLKFLAAWLTKHRRHLLNYAPKNFDHVIRTLESFLRDEDMKAEFKNFSVSHQEVVALMDTLKQEYEVLTLKRIIQPSDKQRSPTYEEKLALLLNFLSHERELCEYERGVFDKLMFFCDKVVGSPYFLRRYVKTKQPPRSDYDQRVRQLFEEVMKRRHRLEWRYYRFAHATSAV